MKSNARRGLTALVAGCVWSAGALAAQEAAPPAPLREGEGRSGTARFDTVGVAGRYDAQPPTAHVAAHAMLPVDTVVEVTSLDTGRTMLVRIADRAPPGAGDLIDLSAGAAEALGIVATPGAAVRVRTAVASPQDQAALRAGRAAAPRSDAPPALLAALRRQLPATASVAARPPAGAKPFRPASVATRQTSPIAVTAPQPPPGARPFRPTPVATPRPAATPTSPARIVTRGFAVQVATLSSLDRARALARTLGGQVASSGTLHRVRLGPFADRPAAERARADAARRGYGDATILRQD